MFRFPRVKFVEHNTLDRQVDHAVGEMLEAVTALNTESRTRIAEELLDCMHSIETALRIMQEKDGIDLNQLKEYVIQKNKVRGYYA